MTIDDTTPTPIHERHRQQVAERPLRPGATRRSRRSTCRSSASCPAELDGRYLRNGPNPVGPVDPATYHWFTGDGMVHGDPAARRAGRVVPQPLGPLDRR